MQAFCFQLLLQKMKYKTILCYGIICYDAGSDTMLENRENKFMEEQFLLMMIKRIAYKDIYRWLIRIKKQIPTKSRTVLKDLLNRDLS